MKKLILSIFLSVSVLLPIYKVYTVQAATCTAPNTPAGCTPATTTTNCSFDKQSNQLCNPLPDNNLEGIILRVLKYVLGLIGTVAVVMIVIAGFRMVLSQGNENAVSSARKTITWAVIGMIVAFLAYSIVAIIQNALITK